MKLNDANPQQHLMIVIFGGACIFLNLITAFKADKGEDEISDQPRMAQQVDLSTGAVTMRETRFNNPKLSWYESIFCRGIQRSSSCSYKMLHPFATDDPDFVVPDGEPEKDHVVYYRGNIGKNTALSRTVESPAAEAQPARIADSDDSE